MKYTYSITSKGQLTVPKEFRKKLGLDKLGKATLHLNDNNEIVITAPKDLAAVRSLLHAPTFKDKTSAKEQAIGSQLAKKYAVD